MPYVHFKFQVFFRAGGLSQLEDIRDEKLTGTIVSLQAKCRGYISRRKLQKLKVNGHFSVSEWLTLNGPFTRTVSVPVSVTVTVKFTLTDRMGSELNLSAKRSITIGTLLNFDGDSDGHRH